MPGDRDANDWCLFRIFLLGNLHLTKTNTVEIQVESRHKSLGWTRLSNHISILADMSHFVVSARKYRPQKFAEVVGQESVTQTLKNAFKNDSLAHAFLFCGPRGVGKTSCARILAKALNCTNRSEDNEPCGNCDSCDSFNRNASLNIIELDAASNNSVEHIRTLNEQVRFQPQEGTSKVFIIDEVHMLSTAAFNAFLKTLEEPPPYAYFILATTEKHKIIPTILSRCQIFDFRRIGTSDMVTHLAAICKQEGIVAEEEALHTIASKADGALRDGLSLFDKIVSFSGKHISYQDVVTNLNLLDYDYFFRLIDKILLEDTPAVLDIFGEVVTGGFEGDALLVGLAQHVRNLLVSKHSSIAHLLDLAQSQQQRYRDQSKVVGEPFLMAALEVLNDSDINYRLAKNKRLHVELALIKLTHLNRRVEVPGGKKEEIEKERLPQKNSKQEVIQPTVDAVQPESTVAAGHSQVRTDEVQNTHAEGAAPEAISDAEVVAEGAADQAAPAGISAIGLGSLNDLVASVRTEQLKNQEAVSKVISIDDVQNSWNNYMELQQSPTVRAVMEKTELLVKNNTIVGMVGSTVSKNVILQENALIEKLREDLGVNRLSISIEIDPTQLSDAPKILTTKEKFEYFCSVNPLFEEFKEKFGLKINHH